MQKNVFICFIESRLKRMRNAFYLMLKALFILEIFVFLPRPFGFVKKLDQKAKINFKIYVIHVLSNMSRSKVYQTMKFGQLIEDKIIYIFLGKSHTKCGREASLRLFLKNHSKLFHTNLSIVLDQKYEMV